MDATIHTDGAARGNPGPAAYAYVIGRAGRPPIEAKGCLGTATNNQAEYEALVRALKHAARLGVRAPVVHSDSELLVRQMNGEYRVKDPALRELYEQATALERGFESLTVRHVRRESNRRADELCNEALDEQRRGASDPGDFESPDPDGEAVAYLREAQVAWRAGATSPSPEDVWRRLRTLPGGRRRPRGHRGRKSL